ncbi:transaldolase [Buchnera aphidicola]|uniref:transaldolase n=1 Tax=Buchnera aphidicola subsp. Tuberolachnus salignus TaxID=98804 RepID=A0A160SXX4_BUCTT|nr:transaldolase [Buchnera aphidicola]CUR53044.1 Transaldolase A [Buchnera aphidicola (Tuberolachnus salignus)]
MNKLESLKKHSTIVVDSGDFDQISKYKPSDATTNPSLILTSILSKKNNVILEKSLKYARLQGGSHKKKIINASDMITVLIGKEISKKIPGYVSTEINSEFSFNIDQCVRKAQKIINLYNNIGVHKSRILIKLAATWEGVKAAEILKKSDILCNLTLIFSFAQARICAESKVFLISPFVGRISDWFLKNDIDKKKSLIIDHGVLALKKIFYYYKKNNYSTIIMGASFRNVDQILSIAGCEKITISPVLLNILKKSNGLVPIKLKECNLSKNIVQPTALEESEFRWLHNQDMMAVEKLAEGIRKFYIDQNSLDLLISQKL